jgi:hypothetical protein
MAARQRSFESSVTAPNIGYYHYSDPPVLSLLTLRLALVSFAPPLGVWLAATWYGFYRAPRAPAVMLQSRPAQF